MNEALRSKGFVEVSPGVFSRPQRTSAGYNAAQLQDTKPKCHAGEKPLGAHKDEARGTKRIAVRVISFRTRTIDPDNTSAKYAVDALRYCGILPEDTHEQITFQIEQEKVKTKSEEKTVVELIYP